MCVLVTKTDMRWVYALKFDSEHQKLLFKMIRYLLIKETFFTIRLIVIHVHRIIRKKFSTPVTGQTVRMKWLIQWTIDFFLRKNHTFTFFTTKKFNLRNTTSSYIPKT